MLQLNCRAKIEDFHLNVAASISADGVTALFGPSGAGKTCLLRVIAGFVKATGLVRFGEQRWLDSSSNIDVPARKRPVGFVFQNPLLFPHLSVHENLRYPLRFGRNSGSIELDQVIEAFELSTLLQRRSLGLSGGEVQRIAIARALLRQPELLLLDEPLTGLDIDRKALILPFLESINREFKIPVLYISHAIDEVATFCDEVVVLNEGRIRISGATEQVMEYLGTHDLVERFEQGSVLQATVTGHDDKFQLAHLNVAGFEIFVPSIRVMNKGESVRLHVRARDISIATERPSHLSIRNVLRGTITELRSNDKTPFVDCVVICNGIRLLSRITKAAASDLSLHVDQLVFVLIKSVTLDHRL